MENISFGNRLREIRERQGVTQKDFAERLGCSRAAYAYYETGKYVPDINFVMALHEKTKYPLAYILGYTDNDTPAAVGLDKSFGLSVKALNQLRSDKHTQQAVNRLLESNYMVGIARSLAKFNFVSACEALLKRRFPNINIYGALKEELEYSLFSVQMRMKDTFQATDENDSYSTPPPNMREIEQVIQDEEQELFGNMYKDHTIHLSEEQQAVIAYETVSKMIGETWGD